jgi:DNA recombination-mediator protein A
MAQRFGRDLAKHGLVIVSGLARGGRAFARRGSVGGRAVAVLGTGIDACYPKENKELFEKVLEKGAINQRIANGLSSRTGELAGPAIASLREGLWVLSLLKASNVAARELRLDWRWSSAEKFSAYPET